LDRRVTNPGSEEQNGHPERVDAEGLQVEERSLLPLTTREWDDCRDGKEAEACLKVLSAALAPVLPPINIHSG